MNDALPFYHAPVMPVEVLRDLVQVPTGAFADCTLGGGGHSSLILSQFPQATLTGFDRDPNAIRHADERLKPFEERFRFVHGRFSSLGDVFPENSLDGILADLGISSRQVDDMERGFSFRSESALDLRMNPEDEFSAAAWLSENDERQIARALRANSDVDRAPQVARMIKALFTAEGALYPAQLVAGLRSAFPWMRDDVNGLAARVIQAIRMEVNEEMSEIDSLIQAATQALKPGGRLVFLTYHSVEDRRVKQGMADLLNPDTGPKEIPIRAAELPQPLYRSIHRKPQLPTTAEIQANPRARSAKLRAYERLRS